MRRAASSTTETIAVASSDPEGTSQMVEPLTRGKATTAISVDLVGEALSPSASRPESIPVGHWRDSLWDFWQYGYCHPTVFLTCCCIPIAAGQVATRLNLTVCGNPATGTNTNTTTNTTNPNTTPFTISRVFRKMLVLALTYWVTRIIMLVIIGMFDPNIDSVEWVEPPPLYHFFAIIDDIISCIYLGYIVYMLRNMRSHVRSKYAIPEAGVCRTGCEDVCCSLWCPCLVASQMMRHTADYEAYPARCCSDRGLPHNAPTIV